jgi:flagellar hook-associated protein 2
MAKALGGTLQTPGPGGAYKFFINGQYFEINGGESVNSMIGKINSSKAGVTLSYSEVTDKFTMTSNTTGAGVGIQISEVNGNLFTAIGLTTGAQETFGSNSISYINGNYIERSSNDFVVDGVRFTLKELYNESASFNPTDPPPSATSGTAVALATNPDDLFDAIKKFVDGYNAMVTNMRGLTKEKAYSDYQPLTDEERGAMTESQIKQWEEKAKSGILANDNLLNNIASKLQNALLGTNIGGFGLYRMGIDSAGYNENGKLKLDENKLKEMLASHPDEVRDLFLNATDGISAKLDKVIDDSVRNNGVKGTRGTLIEMAGYAATRSDLDNALELQIESYNKRIDSFKDLLKKEESRLWSQFSAMETALQRLNEQSSILSQYLGTGTSQ